MKQKWPIQNLKISLIAFAEVVITGSCQKVINIDLQTANSIVVIQAYVTDQPGIDTVKLNYTGSYYNPGHYPAITNAVVVITDNTGAVDTFMQVDSGVYASTHLTGIPGNTYTMKVFA
ncbi:MAG TPA: DUF4249 family protein, partial [Chitinophagales bacterium]|nr:DUF4249 family protein [Chitinophagales bacterium]